MFTKRNLIIISFNEKKRPYKKWIFRKEWHYACSPNLVDFVLFKKQGWQNSLPFADQHPSQTNHYSPQTCSVLQEQALRCLCRVPWFKMPEQLLLQFSIHKSHQGSLLKKEVNWDINEYLSRYIPKIHPCIKKIQIATTRKKVFQKL